MKELIYFVMGFLLLLLDGCHPLPPLPVPTATPEPDMAYRDVVLATQPGAMLAYYEFNGNLDDSGPLALTGAVGTGVSYSLVGVDGTQAALFNGSSAYVDLGSNFRAAVDGANMSAGTAIMWLKPHTDGQWSDGDWRWPLHLSSATGDMQIYARGMVILMAPAAQAHWPGRGKRR